MTVSYATITSEELIINTLQSDDGVPDPTGNSFYSNSSSILLSNGTLSTSITPESINTNIIMVGDTVYSNVYINSTSISIVGEGNTYIDGTIASFTGVVNASVAVVTQTTYVGDIVYVGNTEATYSSINSTSFSGTSNNATYAFGKSESALNVNSALTSNNSTYLGGVAANGYVNTSGAYTLSGNLTFNGNLTIGTSAGINANGEYGTSGQVLTSNGTTVYWSTVTGVNTSAQYTWSNTQTFSNTVYLNAVSANGGLGSAGQVLTSNGSDTYWSSVSGGANATTFAGTSQTFTANGTSNTYSLTESIAAAPDIIVSINGLVQTPTTHYSVSGNTLTFTANPTNNSLIEVRTLSAYPNVATQTANDTIYAFGKSEGALNVNSATYVLANDGIVSNSSGVFVNGNTGLVVNSTGVHVNSSYVLDTDSRTLSGNLVISGTYFNPSANTILLGNSTQRWVVSANTIDATTLSVGTSFISNTSQVTVAIPLSANGGTGSAGQVLTSNGATGSPYWAAASGGFTNGQSISVNNFTITGGFTANSSNGTSGQILTTSGSSVYWSTPASYTAPRVNTATSTATLAWNSSNYDQYQLTAMAANTTVSADSGSPNNGQRIIFRFKDDGTARTLTWTTGSSKAFRAIGTTLPTTTVISKTLYVGGIYNSADDRWDVIAVAQES